MTPRSLRARLLLGAVLWTAGLLIGSLVLFTLLIMKYRYLPAVVHGSAWAHMTLYSMVALVCLGAGFVQVRRGLASVDRLRARLAAVRDGRTRRLDGSYPAEVQPLVEDLNTLLADREQAIARALAKAGDLAHGLKTPLAILAQEASRAERHAPALAGSLREQVERMRRQTEYHLVQARAAAGTAAGHATDLAGAVQGLVRTMLRLHAGKALAIDEAVAAGARVRCQREDVEEMIGNLLDNACKWARGRVAVSARSAGASVLVVVEDDGPGLPEAMRERVLQRGVRADETAPGSGLGLAIVRDLAELYGGAIRLEASALGGLAARLELPGAVASGE